MGAQQISRVLDLTTIEYVWAAQSLPTRTGSRDAGPRALTNQCALELGQRGDHVEHEHAGRRALSIASLSDAK
ncbi:hypothetical protein WT83_29960 [Burkholderia territorii]|uniref:Uncharacterized protein n=1 Tax=Burkholderia territorii TaxID=1503055 RepID=A0A108E5N1_9BURK|nr:hypothetical protein WT83_29960 [Burkholderia territorii]